MASRYLSSGRELPPPSRVDAGVVKVTTTALNLRSGPGLTYKVIRVLAEGTRVTTTGKTAKGFAEVVNGSARGWAAIQYLASSADRAAGGDRHPGGHGRPGHPDHQRF